MAYTPTNWQDGVTPVNAVNMNKLEQGLAAAVGIPADVVVTPATALLIRNRYTAGDAFPSFRLNADGRMEWGAGGASAPDVSLIRSPGSGGGLETDSWFWTKGFLGSEAPIYREALASTEIAMEFYLNPWPGADNFKMLVNGQMQWGPATSPLDVTLRRYGNTTLGIDGSLVVSPPVGDAAGGRIILDVAGGWAYPVLEGGGTGIAFASVSVDNIANWEIYTQELVEGLSIFRKPGGAGPSGDLFRFSQGGLRFGPGGATGNLAVFDTVLARTGPGWLETNGYMASHGVFSEGSIEAYNAPLLSSRVTPTEWSLAFYTTGGAQDRFRIANSGAMNWGDGAAAPDTSLSRSGVNQLYTPGNLAVGTVLTAQWIYTSLGTFFINSSGMLEWGPGDWSRDTNLYRYAVDILATDGQIYLRGADSYLAFQAPPDTHARFFINPFGTLNWGSGTALQDVNLYRSAPDTLKTDDNFEASGQGIFGGNLEIRSFSGAASGAVGIYFTGLANDGSGYIMVARRQSDPNWRFMLGSLGQLSWGDGTAAPDVSLYRQGAIALGTDADFYARALISNSSAYINHGLVVDNANGGNRIYFGSALDTSLYRPAVGVLKTDGQIEVGATGIKFSNGSVQTVAGGGGAVVATTVAGLGAGADGKLGRLRLGTTPFSYRDLIYDATLGKWVSASWSTPMLQSISHNTTVSENFSATRPFCFDYADHVAAGLDLQVRVLWTWRNEDNSQGHCHVDLFSCAEAEGLWNLGGTRLIDLNGISLTNTQRYTSHCDLQPNEWRTLPASWDSDEVLGFRFGVQSNASPGTTTTRIEDMEIIARWISA